MSNVIVIESHSDSLQLGARFNGGLLFFKLKKYYLGIFILKIRQ